MWPAKPFQPNFPEGRYIRSYVTLFASIGKVSQYERNGLTLAKFVDGYTFFRFDLTPEAYVGWCFHLVQKGNMLTQIHFATALARTMNVVMYGEFEAVLEIDNSRNVIDQIARFLARDIYSKIIVRDVVPKDGLPTTMDDYSITFVCNTQDSDPPRSTLDWIALYVPHVPERTLFGVVKAKILQNTLSNACVAYLLLQCNGISLNDFTKTFSTYLDAN